MSKALATKNVAAVLVGVGLMIAFGFTFATPVKAQTTADLQAQITALLAQIAALQGGSGSQQAGGLNCSITFTRSHSMGQSGGEIMSIQKFLNSVDGTQVATVGAGSPGNETSYFGGLTRAAVSKFQQKYGITPTAGFWGPISRAKANSLCASAPTPTPTPPGTPPPVPAGSGLRVSLASDNPAASTIVKSQGIAELAKFTFTNGTGAPVSVTNLAFKRIGVSTDSDLSNIYLYEGAKRISDPAGISSGNFNFNNSAGVITVPAYGSVSVSVRADIGSTNGNQVGVQLTGVTASAPLEASVVLPISGNLHLISNATIATATWGAATPSGGTFAPANEVTLFQSTLTVNNRAVWLKSIQIENRGSTKDGDFTNLKLLVKGTQVGASGSLMNDKIVFDLSANPLKLETGGNEIRLVGDILGTSGETFDFQVRRGIDIMLIDSELNQPLAPTAPTAVTANTVEGIGLSVTKANTSPTENVGVASTGVLWSRFEFRGSGDNVKVEEVTVDVDTTLGVGMDNVRVMLDGVQVGSTADVSETGTTFSLGSSMILTSGKTHVVEIYGDAKTTAGTNYANTDTVDVGVSIDNADTEGIASGDRLTDDIAEVEGNSRTVSSSTLTGTKASGYGDQTIVAGANNAKLGSFTLSTGSTEGVNVNTIVINLSTAEAASVTDIRLVDNATGAQIGSTKSSASTANTFSVNMPMGVSATKTINLIGNIKSGSNAGPWIATLDDTSGGTGATTGTSVTIGSDVNLQTITLGSGTLTVTRDPGTPVNSNVIAGTNSVAVGKFDFAGANSSFTVQELQVKVPNGAATSVSSVTLKYKNSAGAEQTVSQALSVSASQVYATATFTGLTMYVPQNDSADLDVYVDVPSISSGSASGAAISVLIDADNGFKALDSAGSSDTSAASSDVNSAASSGYGTKYVKKTVPTLTRLTTGYTTNTVAAGIGLYRFSVTADAAGAIDWRQISFTVTTTGVELSSFTLYDVTGTAVAVNSAATSTISYGTSGTTLTICPDTSCFNGAEQQIGAGSTKTYELRAATVANWGAAGDQVTISFLEDTVAVANTTPLNLTNVYGMVWSDRSNTSHTTTTSDWTNGYLVKDMDNDTRSCQFGTATTCTP